MRTIPLSCSGIKTVAKCISVYNNLLNTTTIIHADDWRCDQYRWSNQGVAKLPRKDPKLKKHYFHADTPKGIIKDFQRHAYQLMDNENITLIHYVGDEMKAEEFAHRTATKHPNAHYIRTCPSTLQNLEAKCKNEKANVVYKEEVASTQGEPELVPVTTPRNMKQLRNLRHKQLQLSRISHDDMYNLHEIAYDTPGYIHKITTFRDLVCVCGVHAVLEELDRVLLLGSNEQLLSYDTTFQHGDFYVSPLLFRHTLFKENPCIPALFLILIHDRKFADTHKELFKQCAKQIPSHPQPSANRNSQSSSTGSKL